MNISILTAIILMIAVIIIESADPWVPILRDTTKCEIAGVEFEVERNNNGVQELLRHDLYIGLKRYDDQDVVGKVRLDHKLFVSVNGTARTESDFSLLCGVKMSWVHLPSASEGFLIAGFDMEGHELFVCRAKHFFQGRQHYIPGYMRESGDCCNISFASKAICVNDYKFLRYH